MATATGVQQERKADETALITGSEAIAVACKLAEEGAELDRINQRSAGYGTTCLSYDDDVVIQL